MTATAEFQSTRPSRSVSDVTRKASQLVCTICADTMIAAEASALLADNVISYLWTCETCGHGFVTNHHLPKVQAASIAL
ncbi:MAG: hypothetical protein K2W78_15110 [Xanthobacteraceae bacterium]|nr:hypothetical protein [Xanthobacteraceae bacterium]